MDYSLTLCPYCGNAAKLITGAELYQGRPEFADRLFWRCDPCDAHVGTHRRSDAPLGRLADPALRLHKRRAHRVFDLLWSEGHMTRSEAYRWLADTLGKTSEEAHIGLFDIPECQRTRRKAERYLNHLRASNALEDLE